MSNIDKLKNKIYSGSNITKNEAMTLWNEDVEELSKSANEIRDHFLSSSFDICSIINAKNGRCSENCSFCAQSCFNKTGINNYPLIEKDEILREAEKNYKSGVKRFSIVTSGKRLSKREVENVCLTLRAINEKIGIHTCASLGLLDEEDFRSLKDAGLDRFHCNLESSEGFFKNICTTHTFSDKIRTLKIAKTIGISVCSGGIFGVGESASDRIDLAFSLKELDVKSVPVNMLNPIKGTPLENNKVLSIDEMRRIVAIFRFILPDAFIRLAGGRGLLQDKGRSCFLSGSNAVISGDMLTTSGYSFESDLEMIDNLGYSVKK